MLVLLIVLPLALIALMGTGTRDLAFHAEPASGQHNKFVSPRRPALRMG